MSYYYVCETTPKSKTDNEMTLAVGDEISQEELDSLNSAFSLTGAFYSITSIKDIVIENGVQFKKWMNPINLQTCYDNGMPNHRLVMLSNKHVLNYASSIKTFIDMAFRLLKKKKPSMIQDFENLTHRFYDEKMVYRFWMNFRNYVVHCAFPYTTFRDAIGSNCQVVCEKKHLLEFDNWKHSKSDIEQMKEEIDLTLLVDDMSSLIYSLYLQFLYYLAEDAFAGYEYYTSFSKRHNVKSPTILVVEEKISKEKGFVNPSMQPLPVAQMIEMFKAMQNHPSINIKFNLVEENN